jgi:V8-like Glu-specific endopeptidase
MKNMLSAVACGALLIASTANAQNAAHVSRDGTAYIVCNGRGGTAFAINSDTLVTANHVVGATGVCTNGNNTSQLADRDDDASYQVVRRDRDNDVAILRSTGYVEGSYRVNCDPMDSSKTYVYAGYPHGGRDLQTSGGTPGDHYYTAQTNSGETTHLRGVTGGTPVGGMSGGPVLNNQGQVVGVVIGYSPGNGQAAVKELRDTPVCSERGR